MKTFSNKVLTKPEAEQALDTAIALVRRNLPLYTDHCQNHSSVHDIYPQCENNQWTCGFWPGEVWLSYERTGDEAFKNTALTLVDSFLYRIEHKIEVDHHDMGFLYSPSCVAAYKLTGSEKYVGTDEAAEYTKLAAQMLGSVAAHYAVKEGPQGIGLVRHGTYSKKSPYNTCTPEGVDECVSWGDYFYMEALTRLTKDWELYW